jgi:hypothetical protein
MSSRRRNHRRPDEDTDTLTRIDDIADAETIKAHAADPDAETHQLDPRVWSPLRVCPQCSLAWEVNGDWCPSCGTAFDKTLREAAAQPTRVMPRQPRPRRGEAMTAAEARRRSAGEPPLKRSARRGTPPPPPPPSSNGFAGVAKLVAVILLVGAVAAIAFTAGQQSRPSQAEVDGRITQATNTARASAVASLNRLKAEFERRRDAAVKKARAQGIADAQAQNEADQQASDSVIDKIGRCLVDLNC